MQVGEQGRHVGIPGVGPGEVGFGAGPQGFKVQNRIQGGPGQDGFAAQGQIGNGREREHAFRQPLPLVSQFQQGAQSQASAGGVAEKEDRAGTARASRSVAQEPPVSIDGVVPGFRVGVLGGETVIDGQNGAAGCLGEQFRKGNGGVQVAGHKTASVEQEQPSRGVGLRGAHPFGENPVGQKQLPFQAGGRARDELEILPRPDKVRDGPGSPNLFGPAADGIENGLTLPGDHLSETAFRIP